MLAFDDAVAQFGREVARKLRTRQGSPEDHLRGPFERMLSAIARSLGLSITMIGETRLPNLSIRPDYAVDVAGARAGYVELKKPGHGVPETWARPSAHDREQWERFQLLPNVLYADGEQFARYSFGKLEGKVGRLTPELESAGARLRAVSADFARTVTDFLLWKPDRPRSLDELVRLVANLCRLLRDDVAAELIRERSGLASSQTFTDLAMDWRQALFPNLTDGAFADQYAQTVTFALLLARVDGVGFEGRSVGEIAMLLGKKHSLMGRALTVLTDQPEEDHSVALTTMVRVLSVVDWSEFAVDSYAMLYERFLERYDPRLRRQSGVYYTPAPLVTFITRFVDDVLRNRLGRDLGFAADDVIVVDPAMGTGSFLAAVVNTVAATVATEEGPGAVAPRLRELSNRLIGFENQAAPYAVAELRIHSLLRKRHRAEIPARERRFLTNTLDDPDVQLLPLGRMYEAIERSRRGANEVKLEVPVMVVIGNPPYVDKIKGSSAWIEVPSKSHTVPSLERFRKPGNGRLEYVLANKYVYFWRWATWKVFDAHPDHPAGVVAFVCSAGFIAGPGFAGMREYLRRTADEAWIIDLTPEGHQPAMNTRFFRGNQQPICVAVFIRRGEPDRDTPARIHRTAVTGTVEEKAAALEGLGADNGPWQNCLDGWDDPFHVAGRSSWSSMPSMTDLFPWAVPGVKPNRTWVYAPNRETLETRWNSLIAANPDAKSSLFNESPDTNLRRVAPPLPGMQQRDIPFSHEFGAPPEMVRIGYRSFDRQWLVPDSRLISRPRPALWSVRGSRQTFIVEQHARPIGSGPALIFSSLLPDMNCHSGSNGGRVFPFFRDSQAVVPNISDGLLTFLSRELNITVGPEDVFAYLAAIVAHPGFVQYFSSDLVNPGVRVPLTRAPSLWRSSVQVGQEVIWLHTYGDRFASQSSSRRDGPPRMYTRRPKVRVAIPDTEEEMPERIAYDERSQTLYVGSGEIAPVIPQVWRYDVAGMPVVNHWFGYRRKRPAGKRTSPLDDIVATTWTPTMTSELLDLLNVLGRCVELEPRQADLLRRVVAGPLVTVDELTAEGILPVDSRARVIPKPRAEQALFQAE